MHISKLRVILLVLSIAAFAAAASATIRNVSPSGTDSGACTVSPCRTISYAVSQSSTGDVILVAHGTYAESVSITKRLTLIGNHATIDAAGFGNGVVISGTAASGTVVAGFTIENAGKEGLFALKTSRLTIANNSLLNNDAYGPFSEQCPAADPDDCGEALHLQSVTNSRVVGNLVQGNVGGILLTDEDGPTAHNLISNNRVLDNTKDCGITLASHWFQLGSPVTKNVAGVYENVILHNASNGNGAAGIGVFAGPPGAAAWGNVVANNVARNNGLPGVAIHSHTPFQYVNNNVVVNNTLSGNGPDDDAQTENPTGISVFSDAAHGASPIKHTVVAHNKISDEYYGIFIVNATKVSGLQSNTFDNVTVPTSIH
jgi:parallel beta-helix repeat protein